MSKRCTCAFKKDVALIELARDGDTGMVYHRVCGLDMVLGHEFNGDWLPLLEGRFNNDEYYDWLPE